MRTVLTVLCLMLLGSGCAERFESVYASMEEAAADGAVERGWVPAFLPSSTARIREVHDLDTNEVWLRFEYSGADHESMVAELSSASADALRSAPLRDPEVDWWDHEEIMQLAVRGGPGEVYSGAPDDRLLLLLVGRSEGYLWRY